jgi:hypothetical protein
MEDAMNKMKARIYRAATFSALLVVILQALGAGEKWG